MPNNRAVKLTDRERDIVRLVAQGRSNAEIARTLGIQVQTVKNYLTSIYAELGVSRRLQLALYALREGLSSDADGTTG